MTTKSFIPENLNIHTSRGIVRVGDLKQGDELICWNGKSTVKQICRVPDVDIIRVNEYYNMTTELGDIKIYNNTKISVSVLMDYDKEKEKYDYVFLPLHELIPWEQFTASNRPKIVHSSHPIPSAVSGSWLLPPSSVKRICPTDCNIQTLTKIDAKPTSTAIDVKLTSTAPTPYYIYASGNQQVVVNEGYILGI